MPALSRIDVSNDALSSIRAKRIASLNENSNEAEECNRFYPTVIAELLGGQHDWSFAIQRVRLATLATNDRASEWSFAYAVPSNLGNAIRVLPDFDSLGLGLPVPLPGEPFAETWMIEGVYVETPYIIDGATLYSSIVNATLEYTIADAAGVIVPQLFITAVTTALAARLAIPVKGDSERETKLLQAAEIALQRAIADDRNRQPQQSGQYVSEAMAARRGYLG